VGIIEEAFQKGHKKIAKNTDFYWHFCHSRKMIARKYERRDHTASVRGMLLAPAAGDCPELAQERAALGGPSFLPPKVDQWIGTAWN
jgi:hypothetical protein